MKKQRPRVTIRFRYNVETGEIEDFIIDDQAATASESYHDQVAQAVAGCLDRQPRISDAGGRHRPAPPAGDRSPAAAEQPPARQVEEERRS